jgi:hypothetical protein
MHGQTNQIGKGCYISRHIMDNLLGFEPMNEKMFKLSAKLKFDIDVSTRPN